MAEQIRRLSNTRPRDRLGRPLAWGSIGVAQVPERHHIDTATALDEAIAYVDRGLPFHAHEVLEQRWKSCVATEAAWWRAMAQAAAALTHRARGNEIGAKRLWSRAADGVVSLMSGRPGDVSADAANALIVLLWNGRPPERMVEDSEQ